MSTANLLPAPIRRYARRSVQILRRTYRTMSSIPRYRDVDLDCGVTVNVDMRHRNWYQVYQKGYHEQDVEKFITGFLQRGDVVLDVGAGSGILPAAYASRRARHAATGPAATKHSARMSGCQV